MHGISTRVVIMLEFVMILLLNYTELKLKKFLDINGALSTYCRDNAIV